MSITSLVKKLFTRSNSLENPSVPLAAGAWQYLSGSRPTVSGENVSESTSLEIVTVYACVRVLSESVASLPLKLYKYVGNGRAEAVENPVYDLLAVEPNPEMNAFTFMETLVGCLALTGNCYVQIQWAADGIKPIALWPLNPLVTEPVRLPDETLAYKTYEGTNSTPRFLKAEDVIHVPLFSFDGLKGLSPIELARQTLGHQKATQKFGARWFGSGSKPSGILTTKAVDISEQDLINLREQFEAMSGGENQGRAAVLPGDWTYTQLGISPEQSQFLQTLQQLRTEIAALFRVPPHMVGDTSRLSNNNHEQQSLSFVTDTLRPYLARLEKEFQRKLMPDRSGKFFVEFDVTERLRGDFATTMQGYSLGRQWGWYSGNDIRRELGENPGGPELDVYLYPVNMGNAQTLLNPPPPLEPNAQHALPQPMAPKALPGGTGPTESERSTFSRYVSLYIPIFRDGVTRLSKRTKVDAEAISAVLGPTVRSMIASSAAAANEKFGVDVSEEANTRLFTTVVKALDKRNGEWVSATDDAVMAELNKTLRTIHTNTYREAAAAVALKEVQ